VVANRGPGRSAAERKLARPGLASRAIYRWDDRAAKSQVAFPIAPCRPGSVHIWHGHHAPRCCPEPTRGRGRAYTHPFRRGRFRDMSDDLTKRDRPDRDHVNIHEIHELQYWTKRFGVSSDQLKRAIAQVGTQVPAVEKALKK